MSRNFNNKLFEVFKGQSLPVKFMYLSYNQFVKIPQLIANNLTELWLSNNLIFEVNIS